MAGGGLAATARDWAKVALLAVAGGNDRGESLLDPDWVYAAVRPAYPFLESAGCRAASPPTPASATTGGRWTTAVAG